MRARGAVAAGHTETARAAQVVLCEGGNAFDATLAAMCTACVAEPVLCSLGGGGFLIAHEAAGRTVLYDFFTHTPSRLKPSHELDFCPIVADFGPAQQEFHIGMGSIAVPGAVKGLFEIHRELGSMPMERIIEPAAALARRGVEMTRFQGYLFRVIGPILSSSAASRAIFHSPNDDSRLLGEGETLRLPEFADALEALAREGGDLFYRGELARCIERDVRENGGLLGIADLEAYRVEKRAPLELCYRDARLATNPPPSSGGILIAFALELLKEVDVHGLRFGSAGHLDLLARVMEQTNKARVESGFHEEEEGAGGARLLEPKFLEAYRRAVLGRPAASRGTTHIGVIDARGNAAGLTLTNGEGCGYVVPGTGVMLNNMLGEEDINPLGFHRYRPGTRMCSMMSPSLIFGPGDRIAAIGSGGSNRIRTAILQVLVNLLDFRMTVSQAVESPRIHYEGGLLNIEPGFDDGAVARLIKEFPRYELWGERNLFFGGAHTVALQAGRGTFEGAGDPRRSGIVLAA
jgi:gamma-glutamyltranspeptidase/glutathione hydrolase